MPSACIGSILRRLCDASSAIVSPETWCLDNDELEPSIVTRSDRAILAVSTPQWFCVDRCISHPSSKVDLVSETSLFLKPDDIDDTNDVGRLRADVVNQLISIVKLSNK
jgi:hypothetical protein